MTQFIKYVAFLSLWFVVPVSAQDTYFPPDDQSGEWATISPDDLEWSSDSIAALYAFLEAEQSKSFVLLKDGKIVLERYFGTYVRDSIYPWFSAGKSLRSVLVGIAQEEGYLSLDDPTSDYLGTGWTSLDSTQEAAITIRNQVSMTSGLNELFFTCTLPICLRYRAPAGDRWAYHNGPYSLTKDVLETATDTPINAYTNSRIENKLGMSNGFWIGDTQGNTFYFSPARDMARFGWLVLNDGNWNGTSVWTDTTYFRAMLRPSQELNPSYGYLWWLNGQPSYVGPDSPETRPGPISPSAPDDVAAAIGARGQYISISPSLNMVMVRQGLSGDSSLALINLHDEIWARILRMSGEINTSTVEVESEEAPLVFPNPSSGEVRFTRPRGDFSVDVIDLNGRRLRSFHNLHRLDLRKLPPGRYQLSITEADGKRWSRPVVLTTSQP